MPGQVVDLGAKRGRNKEALGMTRKAKSESAVRGKAPTPRQLDRVGPALPGNIPVTAVGSSHVGPTLGWWLTDQVMLMLQWVYSWSPARADGVAGAAGRAVSRRPPGIEHFQVAATDLPAKFHAIRVMGEARGIDMSPLVQVQLAWQALWQRHPEPVEALHRFREFLPEQPTTLALTQTVGRLRDRMQVEVSSDPNQAKGPPRFDALELAFRTFTTTLDAATVPLPDGSRRIDGVAHAVALSEATESLHRELALAHTVLMERHGRPMGVMPPGIVIYESDTPGGEGTPIPLGEMEIKVMAIGRAGADAKLAAAMASAQRVAAFPADRFNAQQAMTPGRHQRWIAGDVITGEDLARLNGASKLIDLYRAGFPPEPAQCWDGQLSSGVDWWFPAKIYREQYGIPAPRLRQAAKDRRIKSRWERRGIRKSKIKVYLFSSVKAVYPEDVVFDPPFEA